MADPKNQGYLLAGGLAVLGVLAMGHGMAGNHPSQPRYYGGPRALWHIPDGKALPPSDPVRIEIPDAGVKAPIRPVGKNRDGTVQVPPLRRAHYTGWYRYGPAPGSRGSAVVLGHYDDLSGAAAFYRLGKVRPGDIVRVTRRDRTTAVFKVDAVEQVRKHEFPRQRVYGPVRYAGLRLVTCGGTYDRSDHSYRDNVIVYAHLVGGRG